MGERAKIIINEYTALEILQRTDFDINKFYTSDYKIFISAAAKEIRNCSELRKKYNDVYQENINLKYQNQQLENALKSLKGVDETWTKS